MTGTVIKASRRQKFFDVVFDGCDNAQTFTLEQLVKSEHTAFKSDIWSGDGVVAGDRVVMTRDPSGWIIQATGDVWPCDPGEEHRAPTSDKSPEQLHAAAMRGTNDDRLNEYFRTQGPPRDPDKDEELLYGK